MGLLPQLNAIHAHSCLRQGASTAAGAARSARCCLPICPNLPTVGHPEDNLDLMVALQDLMPY